MVYNDYVEPISARRMHKAFFMQNGRDSSPKGAVCSAISSILVVVLRSRFNTDRPFRVFV